MICAQSLEAVALLAATTEKRLSAVSGSPLDIISRTFIDGALFTVSGLQKEHGEEFTLDEIINIIRNSGESAVGDYDPFNEQINELVAATSNIVKNNIYIARNVILPLVEDYTEIMNTAVNENVHLPSIALRIVTDNSKNILSSTVLHETVKPFENYNGLNYSVSCQSYVSIVDLEKCLKTGSSSLDKVLEEWYASADLKPKLQNAYDRVYANGTRKPLDKVLDTKDFETLIFVLLLAKLFQKEIPEGTDCSLEQYQNLLAGVVSTTSKYICNVINRNTRNISSKQLVTSYPAPHLESSFENLNSGKNDIFVHPTVYEDFINKGGKPEIIFGAYLNDRSTDLDTLLEKASVYERQYNRTVQAIALTKSNKVLTIVRSVLGRITGQVVNDINNKISNDETNTYKGVSYEHTAFAREANEFIRRLTIRDIDNLYEVVKNFICTIYFKNTEAVKILDRIDKIDPNGETDINDVAIVASVDTIVDWLLKQLTDSDAMAY